MPLTVHTYLHHRDSFPPMLLHVLRVHVLLHSFKPPEENPCKKWHSVSHLSSYLQAQWLPTKKQPFINLERRRLSLGRNHKIRMIPREPEGMEIFSDPFRIARVSANRRMDRMVTRGRKRNAYLIVRIFVVPLMSSVHLELYPGYKFIQ